MAAKGARVHVYGDWDGSGIKKAQKDVGAFGKQVDGFSGQIKKSFSGIGIAIGAAVAGMGVAITKFTADSISAASDLEESQSKVTQVFGDQASQVLQWSRSSAEAFGQSQQQALEAAGTYGNLLRAFGLTTDAAQSMSTTMVELAADLASFNNTSIDDAIQAIRSGLSGETEPLKRFGVALTDARLKAEAMAMGIYDGAGALDAGQKAQAAYGLILKDTTLAQGDFARTSDGLANTQRILAASVADAQAQIGGELLESIMEVGDALGGSGGMVKMIKETANGVEDLIEIVPAVARALGRMSDDADDAASSMIKYNDQMVRADEVSNETLRNIVGYIPLLGGYAQMYLGVAESNNIAEQAALDNANAQAALEAGYAANARIADRMANANIRVAQSAMAAAAGTLEAAIATGQVPKQAARGQRFDVAAMLDNIGKSASSAGSSLGSAATKAEKMRIKFSEAAKGFGDAAVSIEGDSVKVSQALGTAFEQRTDVFRQVVQTQVGIIQSATAELDSYAESVKNSVLGSLDFTTTDSEGNPLTPEQIVNTLFGDIANRQAAVQTLAESNIMTQLPEALANKILALPPDAAVALANYFSANPTQLEQLTANYNALATFTETALGVPMATTFATVGDESAVKMIEKARDRIGKAANNFKKYVKRKLSTEITVGVRYVAVNSLPGVSGGTIEVKTNANGGKAMAGLPTLVGERGPELLVPSVDSTVVRGEKTRSLLKGGGGDVYLTVNAGMGTDGAEVGRQIVDALKSYERRNGPVYASA